MRIENGISNQSIGVGSLYGGMDATGTSDGSNKNGFKTGECETCKKRKYQDGSNENVSFKAPTHISTEAAAGAVRAHEGEHVSNAYKKAAQKNGKVINASVSIHTGVCPECGKVYISGGTTSTQIRYSDDKNPYQQDKKAQDQIKYGGQDLNLGV